MGLTIKEALFEAADLVLVVLVPIIVARVQVLIVAYISCLFTVAFYITAPVNPAAFTWHVKLGYRLVDVVSSIFFEPMDDPVTRRHEIRGFLLALTIRPADKVHILSRFGQRDRRGRGQKDHNQQQK